MTNEEFQRMVLEKFENLETSIKGLDTNVKGIEIGQKSLEMGQEEIKKDIGAIVEQTADLTEFREEVKDKLDTLVQESLSMHQILGEHEVAIRTLRRRVI